MTCNIPLWLIVNIAQFPPVHWETDCQNYARQILGCRKVDWLLEMHNAQYSLAYWGLKLHNTHFQSTSACKPSKLHCTFSRSSWALPPRIAQRKLGGQFSPIFHILWEEDRAFCWVCFLPIFYTFFLLFWLFCPPSLCPYVTKLYVFLPFYSILLSCYFFVFYRIIRALFLFVANWESIEGVCWEVHLFRVLAHENEAMK